MLQELPADEPNVGIPVYSYESDPNDFQISKIPDGWQVSGDSIERAAKMTYWEFDQSIRRFQRILTALGIDEALREAGIEEGDLVFIGEQELEWSE